MHVERITVRVSGSMVVAALIAFVLWLSTGSSAWRFVAAGAFLVGALVASAPLLFLALNKLLWERRG
jgi:hypothetical protein